jgi:NAD(P)-dependent dehydrogenase (short-subunit alcohol dehydrogenase family)
VILFLLSIKKGGNIEMKVADKVVVVTGGASGIGRALCQRFAQEGAKGVTVADIDEAGAKAVADEINGLAMKCDVGREEDILTVIRQTEEKFGPIDLFCSNAGISVRAGIETPNEVWQKMWDIHVMAHVYAARALIPGMIERGGGYLLNVSSAAGLLSTTGSTAYTATKHAAVGLAENIAIMYGDQGIKISLLCPQAVRSGMTREEVSVAALDGRIEAEEAADIVVKALEEERFLILTHQEVDTYVQRKASDRDRWLAGMRRLRQRHAQGQPLKAK